jgi:hypothetical protein
MTGAKLKAKALRDYASSLLAKQQRQYAIFSFKF